MMQGKADENYKAGEMLAGTKYYSASVHCFYYSVLQLMKYVLCAKCRLTYQHQDSLAKGKDSHTVIRDKIISNILDPKKQTEFMQRFNKLKKDRVTADYSPSIFTEKMCLSVKQLTDELTSIIKAI